MVKCHLCGSLSNNFVLISSLCRVCIVRSWFYTVIIFDGDVSIGSEVGRDKLIFHTFHLKGGGGDPGGH